MLLSGATPASADFLDTATLPVRVGHQQVKPTLDGYAIMTTEANTSARTIPPLDGSPFSREAFLNGVGIGQVDGPAGANVGGAFMEVGYEVGYPVAFAPNGITVTLNSPSVSVTGAVRPEISAGVTPQLNIAPVPGAQVEFPLSAKLGAELGAQATILPSQQLSFQVGHGGITETTLAKFTLTRPFAYADLSNTHLTVTGALGPVTIRTFVKFTLITAAGQTSDAIYSDPITL
ncbi:MspA family porin [Nocardia altamirensis]|uniref:MspA family porin n=1 Tax=Nocardia altamirensis TaxID=472158 RepID=UPI00084021F4|nr:MspA family porin [Nocardia altamirensis]